MLNISRSRTGVREWQQEDVKRGHVNMLQYGAAGLGRGSFGEGGGGPSSVETALAAVVGVATRET